MEKYWLYIIENKLISSQGNKLMQSDNFEPALLNSTFLTAVSVIAIIGIVCAAPMIVGLFISKWKEFTAPYRSSIPGIPEAALIIDTVLLLIIIFVTSGVIWVFR